LSDLISEILVSKDHARPTAAQAKNMSTDLLTAKKLDRKKPKIFLDALWGCQAGVLQRDIADRLLATRQVSGFPHHLRYVADLVRRAKTSLYIVVDCVDHGSFSAPELHDAVLRGIEDVKR